MEDVKARNSLIVENLPRCYTIARVYRSRYPSIDLDDLISIATCSMVGAACRYDPCVCRRFWTYAQWRVEGAIKVYIRDCLRYEPREEL